MNCVNCGKANLKRQKTRLAGEVRGERFLVSMEGLVCPKCSYRTVEGVDLPDYMRLVADAYRSKHGLLTSREIRSRRQQLGMSQAEFADYLGVGVASLKRWEMGRVQDVSSDELIKLRTDERAAVKNLERLQEVYGRVRPRPAGANPAGRGRGEGTQAGSRRRPSPPLRRRSAA